MELVTDAASSYEFDTVQEPVESGDAALQEPVEDTKGPIFINVKKLLLFVIALAAVTIVLFIIHALILNNGAAKRRSNRVKRKKKRRDYIRSDFNDFDF